MRGSFRGRDERNTFLNYYIIITENRHVYKTFFLYRTHRNILREDGIVCQNI